MQKLVAVLEVERIMNQLSVVKQQQIQFVRQGEATAVTREARRTSLVDRGHDWELKVDLDRKLVFPYIRETKLRLDTLLVFQQSKKSLFNRKIIVMMAHESKRLKSADVIKDCKGKGWCT